MGLEGNFYLVSKAAYDEGLLNTRNKGGDYLLCCFPGVNLRTSIQEDKYSGKHE